MNDKDKQLKLLRGLQKLKLADVKSPDYKSPLEDDIMVAKGKAETPEAKTKVGGMTQKIDTKQIAPILSGSEWSDKIAKLRALKAAGKKALGVLPFAGAGMAALQGNPAMAAEELATDVAGPAAEALRSESAGMSPEEEKQMLAERDAMVNYQNSPAAKAAKLAKLQALIGKK